VTSVGSAAAREFPVGGVLAAGETDPGRQREVNEDRFHCNATQNLFMVIDGVGGQAAGGRAAEIALDILRERLGRPTGSIGEAIRDGITDANNEIYRLAAMRPEWDGMACVLTVVMVNNGIATFGHVGDTRLYKLHRDSIEKLTRDHSPVGEREDANEISERQAMHHARRNEVYRDVGSELHDRGERGFIDIGEVTFESDAALLLCSDGLTDLVDSASIARIVGHYAGAPDAVVRALIEAANAAGGKDNVTVVYVEGESFAGSNYGGSTIRTKSPAETPQPDHAPVQGRTRAGRAMRIGAGVLLAALIAAAAGRALGWSWGDLIKLTPAVLRSGAGQVIVETGGSIAAALESAGAGWTVVVEPGEYREQITLKSGVRLVSQVPGGATIRLPAAVPDAATVPAVVARNVSDAEFVGFKVSGDSATPLPVGILVEDSAVSIVNNEVTGATQAAVEFAGSGTSALMANEIRDNPGAALIVRGKGSPRISHNEFARNGSSRAAIVVQGTAAPIFVSNVFAGTTPGSFAGLDSAAQAALSRENYFVSLARASSRPASAR
jgi:PPM family protein phosphatase